MKVCPSTLKERTDGSYSPGALRRLSDRRAFPKRLDFGSEEFTEFRAKIVDRMSISGVQDKLSLRLERGKLLPVAAGGQYILKPVPNLKLPRLADDVPANEHLTMQLAEQIFGIDTAANTFIPFADGEPAYLTRRFDRTFDGEQIAQEDFCQLSGRTPHTAGRNYKYEGSYEEMGDLLRQFCSAHMVETERIFRRIVVNYALANGDAHLKNFSLRQTDEFGDYVLSPAYDLLCTQLHLPEESRLALDLFRDDEIPAHVLTYGFVTGADLLELANRLGVLNRRAETIIDDVIKGSTECEPLVERSFLSPRAKTLYLEIIDDRRRALEIG